MVTSISRDNLGKIGGAMERLLVSFAEKNNLVVEYNGGTYGDLEGVVKLRVKIKDAGGGKSAAQVEFERHCKMLGLAPADWGRAFIFNGKRFTIYGVKLGGIKYDTLGKAANGRIYKFQAFDVKRGLLPVAKAA